MYKPETWTYTVTLTLSEITAIALALQDRAEKCMRYSHEEGTNEEASAYWLAKAQQAEELETKLMHAPVDREVA